MCQSVSLFWKTAVLKVGCVFVYFCGGHKNICRLQFCSSFKDFRDRYQKHGVSKNIVHEIQHVDFQLYWVCPAGVISIKTTAEDNCINKQVQFFLHQTMSVSKIRLCEEKEVPVWYLTNSLLVMILKNCVNIIERTLF